MRLLEADIGDLLEEEETPVPPSPPPSVKPLSSFVRKAAVTPKVRDNVDRRSIASSVRQRSTMPPPPPRRPIPDDDDGEFDIDEFLPQKTPPPAPTLQDDQTTLPLPDDNNLQQQSEQMERQNLLFAWQRDDHVAIRIRGSWTFCD